MIEIKNLFRCLSLICFFIIFSGGKSANESCRSPLKPKKQVAQKEKKARIPQVSIEGKAEIGSYLTAVVNSANTDGVKYQWYRTINSFGPEVEYDKIECGGNDRVYKVKYYDDDKRYLKVVVEYRGNTIVSTPTKAVSRGNLIFLTKDSLGTAGSNIASVENGKKYRVSEINDCDDTVVHVFYSESNGRIRWRRNKTDADAVKINNGLGLIGLSNGVTYKIEEIK